MGDKLSFSYLTGYFGGVSDMHHGWGDLQAREVLAPHVLLKVLLIVFLLAAKIRDEQTELRQPHAGAGVTTQIPPPRPRPPAGEDTAGCGCGCRCLCV